MIDQRGHQQQRHTQVGELVGVVGDAEGVGSAPNGHGLAGKLAAAFRQVEVERALHLIDVGPDLVLEFFLGLLDLLFPGGDGVIPSAGLGFLEFAAGAGRTGGAVLFRRVAVAAIAATGSAAAAVASPASIAAALPIAAAPIGATGAAVATPVVIAAAVVAPAIAATGVTAITAIAPRLSRIRGRLDASRPGPAIAGRTARVIRVGRRFVGIGRRGVVQRGTGHAGIAGVSGAGTTVRHQHVVAEALVVAAGIAIATGGLRGGRQVLATILAGSGRRAIHEVSAARHEDVRGR